MEREIIAVRVRAGLANARAKGIHIGRKKTRPSELIRALLKKKMKYKDYVDLEVMQSFPKAIQKLQ